MFDLCKYNNIEVPVPPEPEPEPANDYSISEFSSEDLSEGEAISNQENNQVENLNLDDIEEMGEQELINAILNAIVNENEGNFQENFANETQSDD